MLAPKLSKIITPPFNIPSDLKGFETIANLLSAILTGGSCIGFESIDVIDSDLSSLSIPTGTVYALIVCESDPAYTLDKSKLIRIKQFDTDTDPPTAEIGMPMGELGVIEIKNFENLKEFRAISIDAGFTHKLSVEYYG